MGMINRYRHRYRPIRKLQLSVIIGIGRYEKKVIGRPLHYVQYIYLQSSDLILKAKKWTNVIREIKSQHTLWTFPGIRLCKKVSIFATTAHYRATLNPLMCRLSFWQMYLYAKAFFKAQTYTYSDFGLISYLSGKVHQLNFYVVLRGSGS